MLFRSGLYQNGVELELVSRILGHTSTQTTRIYASPSIEMLKKAMENNSVDVSETAEWLDDEEELASVLAHIYLVLLPLTRKWQ